MTTDLRTNRRGGPRRRYDAPPGYRACINPTCAAGPDGTRNVLPESAFPRHGPRYRAGMCRACLNAYTARTQARLYRANPALFIAKGKRYRAKRQAEQRDERTWRGAMAQRVIVQLLESGWTQKAIGRAIGCHEQSIGHWRRGLAIPQERRFLALYALAREGGTR
jgi:hypothetical protein